MSRTVRTAAAVAARTVVVGASLLIIVGLLGPLTGQYRTLTVLTGSMSPTLEPGSVLISVPVAARDVRPGHVITFERTGAGDLTTHRVVSVESDDSGLFAVTKGDANNAADVARVELTGDVWRQRGHVPYVGHGLVRLQNLEITRYLGLLFAALLAGIWLIRIWAPRPADTEAAEHVSV